MKETDFTNLHDRKTQKQSMRDADEERIRLKEISSVDLRRENHILAGIDLSRFRIVSIGKRLIS